MRLLAFAILTAAIVLNADAPSFDAVSIRPAAPNAFPLPVEVLPEGMQFHGGPGTNDSQRIRYQNVTLQQLLARAYNLDLQQVSGPGWVANERYDINATLAAGTSPDQLRLMLQGLLNDRFKVQMRRESKPMPVYVLTVLPGGSKLKAPAVGPPVSDPEEMARSLMARPRAGAARGPALGFYIPNGTVQELVRRLSLNVDRPILDETKLTGNFAFDLKWTPEAMSSSGRGEPYPDLFTALQQQMGLKLSPRNEVLETIVVESAERAPAN